MTYDIRVTYVLFRLAFFSVRVVANLDHHPGFISIDCGSTTSSSYHGLNYTTDETYITTGANKNVSPSFISDADEGFYNTVRSFSGGTRNCYTLSPMKPNNKYLIRARFMYGNYDGQETAPKFDVYVGVDFWLSIQFKDLDQKLAKEIIHYSVSDSVDVCLVGIGHRSPFISAIELRPLDELAYDASSNFSLKLWNRWDVGRQTNSSDENDDAYNRLWYMHNWSNDSKVIRTNEKFVPSSDDPYKVPNGVLSTACEQTDSSHANLTYSYRTDIPNAEIYVYWHFAELELLDSDDIREFYIHVPLGNGYTFGPIRPKHLKVTTVKSGLLALDGEGAFVFSLNKTDRSNRYPILNAVEMYKKLPLGYPTNQEDVDAITEIKKKFVALNFWQGDPCLPKNTQWDGLTCNYTQNPPRISSLKLNSRNLSGELPPSLFELKSLESLNLANNGFTGKIPDFLGQMPSLIDIDLTGNNLTRPIPPQLLERACNNSISLRLEGVSDACKMTTPNKKRHRFIIPLVSSIASFSIFLVIIGVIFFLYKRRQKQGLISQTLKSINKRFKYSDIVKMTDNFRKISLKGAFGSVYYGLLQDGNQVAVKILNDKSSAITLKQFCVEAELLTKIHHVNLVSLIGYCEERSNIALVYEYMSGGNLKMHLSAKNNHPLDWKTRVQISIDAAQGLEYLHSGCQPTIIHMDVKPENILLDQVGHAKLSDFGLSRFFIAESEANVTIDIAGTLGYLDPEYCRLHTISDKSDVYGFGVVLLELITGKPAIIKQGNRRDQCVHIIKWATEMVERGDILEIVDKRLQGEFSVNTAWRLLEVAMACVNLIGSRRPKMSEIVADLKCVV